MRAPGDHWRGRFHGGEGVAEDTRLATRAGPIDGGCDPSVPAEAIGRPEAPGGAPVRTTP